ncbi:MAG: TonB-dependent siderophore receptor [Achromobacter sp.]|jgi:iron complex outermembrane receptor protein|uniref:Ferrichrome outer membrane transporter/phage receptor n=2 Tax=Achromobacter TaxID=222 RepID=A0A6J5B4B4_9BURK|nr:MULTISPECIES: TonB-dependent siderophore receptor [Achromobacter]MBN9638822.1 TonB-dependent siderophore receptor [Achromobacter sp.]CAB3690531.1 Ferrichrome outer membrane transporter/phage receptor [Achromobacter insuavis]CUJ55478.1 Ferric hydroxamate uptake [Achromobacter sp. 2789STDY5608628]
MQHPRFTLAPLTLALWLALAGPAQAQPAAPDARIQATLPAQPLGQSLNALARQAGLDLIAGGALVQGLTAPAVSGNLTVREAFERVLAGSGLTARIDGGAVVVSRETTAPVQQLEQITVTGSEETATSPVYGAVARRTSTGIKTDSDLLETPQSVSVVTRDQIELQGATGIDESLRYTSGVVAAAYGQDPRGDWIRVRGFAPAKYLDGLPLPDGSWTANTRYEPYALERIEVLKGPSSVMYGALPPSGFINAVSKRPQAEAAHELGLSYGTDDRKELTGDFTGPLTENGKLLYRVVGLARDSGTPSHYGYDRRYLLAPSLTWNPSADTSLTVLAMLQGARSRGWGGFLPAQGTLLPNPNGKIRPSFYGGEPGFDRYEKNTQSLGYLFAHRVNGQLTLRQNARMNWTDVDHPSVGLLGFAPGSLTTLNRYTYTPRENSRMFSIDNQAEYKLDTGPLSHTLLAGFDYKRSRNDYAVGMGFDAPTLDAFNPVYGTQPIKKPDDTQHTLQVQQQMGVYLQDQIRWGGWVGTLSGRHDWVDTKTRDLLADTRTNQQDRKWSGRVGLNYLFESGLSPYVSYATSFEPAIGRTYSGTPFVPVTGSQVEAGLKYRPPNSESLYTLAVFDLRQKNVLVTDVNAPVFGYEIQQGEIRSRGVELEARAQVTSGVTVIGSYTYTDAKVEQSTDPATVGKQVQSQPRHQAALWVDYRFPQDIAPGFGLGGGVRYTGSSYGDSANQWKSGSNTLVDAQAHYTRGNWRLLLTVNNLFDKEYITACNSITWCYYGYGRSVNLTARYAW